MPGNIFLTFSDSAKYAEAAKNFILGLGLTIHHLFFASGAMSAFQINQGFTAGFPPLTSLVLSVFFKFFGASDKTVFITGVFFFILNLLLVFIIGKTLGRIKTGIISVAFFLSSLFFYEYAFNFSSETLFIFEILLIVFLYLKTKNIVLRWLLIGVTIYAGVLTRQQTIFVAGALMLASYGEIVHNASQHLKKKLYVLGSVGALGGIALLFIILSPTQILQTSNISTKEAPGTFLRNEQMKLGSGESLVSKVFYNTYNFAKSPERILPPTLLLLFISLLFVKTDEKTRFVKTFSAISFFSLILAASLTLPNARYIHPILPLIFICSVLSLEIIADKLISDNKLRTFFIVAIILLISLPAIGHFTLDARFQNRLLNTSQPPVYRLIAKEMAIDIPRGHLIITNLDAWAAWYEGLTTMWFPISPDQLSVGGKRPTAEYIVITNYLENDADFALGEWKEVVYSPNKISNQLLLENYELVKTFIIPAKDNYQNIEIKGTILKIKP